MKTRSAVIGMALAVGVAAVAWAGMGYTMKCNACKFEEMVMFGGGMMFNQVTCWCDSCGKFVNISWKTRDLNPDPAAEPKVQPKPEPLGKVWDPATGRKIEVYACPVCKKPASVVDENMKFCPKCGKPEFGKDPNAPAMAVD